MKIINFLRWCIKDNTYQDNYFILAAACFVMGILGMIFFGPASLLVGSIGFFASIAGMGLHALSKKIKSSWDEYSSQVEYDRQRIIDRLAGKSEQETLKSVRKKSSI